MKKYLFAALLFALAVPAHSTMITIEPDDFIGKGAITSPYAIIRSLSEGIYSPVTATTRVGGGFDAPTGRAVFASENIALDWNDVPFNGFSIEFLVPVKEFTIGAINTTYWPGNGIDLLCWRSTVERGGCDLRTADGTLNGGDYGVGYFAHIWDSAPISQVLLGGGDTIGGYQFDRITFEVPEPATGALLAAGLFLIGVTGRRRFAIRTPGRILLA